MLSEDEGAKELKAWRFMPSQALFAESGIGRMEQHKEQFEEYIASARDCDAALLDAAVGRGLRRARDEGGRLDAGKFIRLAGAAAAAAALCALVNLEPVRAAAPGLLPTSNLISQSGAEALRACFNDWANTVVEFLGGF